MVAFDLPIKYTSGSLNMSAHQNAINLEPEDKVSKKQDKNIKYKD